MAKVGATNGTVAHHLKNPGPNHMTWQRPKHGSPNLIYANFAQKSKRCWKKIITRDKKWIFKKNSTLINNNKPFCSKAIPPAHRFNKEKFLELQEVNILPHPVYSRDIALSDYGLTRWMAHFLNVRIFDNYKDVKIGCKELFASKPEEWYRHQIELLSDG